MVFMSCNLIGGMFQRLEHSSDEGAGHEDHGELVIVLVISAPDGVILMVKVFPEPGHRLGLIVVGVKSLPFLEIKTSLGHLLEWVRLLRLCWDICLWLGFLLLLFFLLLRLLLFLLGG